MTAIGPMRHRFAHQTAVALPDGMGGVSRTFFTLDHVWGAFGPPAGSAAVRAERPVAELTHHIILRGPHMVAPGDRLRLGARLFAVLAVTDPDGRGRLTRCRCREEQA